MNNEIETLYPIKKKRNNKVLIIIIILILLIGISLFLGLKKQNNNSNENKEQPNNPVEKEPSNEETDENDKPVEYKCHGKSENIEFATVSDYYEFTYQGEVVTDSKQIYVFKFINNNHYNKIGKKELFPKNNDNDVEEKLDDSTLTKTYYLKNFIPYTEENIEVNEYIKLVEEKGYTCELKK